MRQRSGSSCRSPSSTSDFKIDLIVKFVPEINHVEYGTYILAQRCFDLGKPRANRGANVGYMTFKFYLKTGGFRSDHRDDANRDH